MLNNKVILIGALTSKPYSFKARSWELENIETLDLFDSLCSNIRVDIKGSTVMRILPINNDSINKNWISDKARYAYDGLNRKRFINPMIKRKNFFIECSWSFVWKELELLFYIWRLKSYRNLVIKTGNYNDLEHLIVLKKLIKNLNSWISIIINSEFNYNADLQSNYLLNDNLFKNTGSKIIICIGVNLKLDNPVLNIRLNQLNRKNHILICSIGVPSQNKNIYHISNNIKSLQSIIEGKHAFCTIIQNFLKKNLKNKKVNVLFKNDVFLLFGPESKKNIFTKNILNYLNLKKNKFIKFNINCLELYSGYINVQELGLYSNYKKVKKFSKNIYYLLNCETIKNLDKSDYIIFQGHHNDKIYDKFNMILPTTHWLEKTSSFLNCFGIYQKTTFVMNPPKGVKLDWQLTELISKSWTWYSFWSRCQKGINFKKRKTTANFTDFYKRKKKLFFRLYILNNININKSNITYINISQIHEDLNFKSQNLLSFLNINKTNIISLNFKEKRTLYQKFDKQFMPFKLNIHNYYKISSIEKSSKIMTNCSKLLNIQNNNFLKI